MSSYWRGSNWTASNWDANNWLGPNQASGDVIVSLTGLRGTSTGGLLTPHLTITITGLRADTAQGALSIGSGVEVALAGLAATASGGLLLPALDVALLGQRVQTAIGLFRFPRDDSGISVWATDRDTDLFVSMGPDGVWVVSQPEASTSLEQQVQQYEALFHTSDLWLVEESVPLFVVADPDESSQVVEPVDLVIRTDVPSLFVVTQPEEEEQRTETQEVLVLN